MCSKRKTDLVQDKEIVSLYISGYSKEMLKHKYGVSQTVIDRVIRESGIRPRDNSHKKRYYSINEYYFDEINTQNKAYILGLLYSDGTNYRPCNLIKIALQDRDASILDSIRVELCSNHPIKIDKLSLKNPNWRDSHIYTIVNKHMSEQLEKLGVVQKKSLVLTFPQWLPNNLVPHFLRGYLDGDGHIETGKAMFVTLAGTEDFCHDVKTYLSDNYSIESSIYNTANKDSVTKLLNICGMKNIKTFLDLLYKDAILYIPRKYEAYIDICNRISNSPAKWRLVGVT